MLNKKAYTIVELLASIVILGLLATLAYMGVSKYFNKALDTTYKNFEENIKTAATNYLLDNSNYIPKKNGSLVIDASKLICDGYLDDLEDPKNESKTCNIDSYVIVKRDNDNNLDMTYQACLKCSDYQSDICSTSINNIERLRKDEACEVE